jgi:general secretion pathway protein N
MRWRLSLLALSYAVPVGALLSGVVAREVPERLPPASVAAGAAPGVAALPAPARGPWPEQVARPLFAQTRRPPPPPEAPPLGVAPPEPELPPPLAATGVVIGGAGPSVALLRLADGGHARAVEGEELGGWRVERISAEGVELARGTQRIQLAPRAPSAPGLLRGE